MDDFDKKIIEMLYEDARRPFTEIADKLDVSEATIRKRVRRLEDEKIIEGYRVMVDPAKLGYKTRTLLGLDVEPGDLLDASRKISEIESVKEVYTCTGDHMIMADIWAKDSKHLSQIISDEIGELEGITDICPAIVMEKIK